MFSGCDSGSTGHDASLDGRLPTDGAQPTCELEPCLNGGTCDDSSGTISCICAPGYEGDLCEVDIDDCADAPCQNDGTCIDEVDGFTCDCPDGWAGDTCEEEIEDCDPNPCMNGGTCDDSSGVPVCTCPAGFDGSICNVDIDECDPDPCLNGGACSDGIDSFTCACPPGYVGATCETDVDDCASAPCLNGGTCTDGVDSFTCACAPGYIGVTCETDVDDCASGPCLNGGTCTDGVDSYTCACAPGYTGATCETDIDDCAPNPCLNGGSCTDGVDSYTCSCAAGYTGPTCSTNIDDCSPNPCLNGGSCTDGVDSFMCACPAGYTGPTCGTNVDDCAPNPCLNGGTCTDGVDSYTCSCAAGYSGPTCSTNIDDCSPNPCLNGGTCTDGVDSFTCACAGGYTGPTCSTAPSRRSCLEILNAGESTGSGTYMIDVDAGGPLAPISVYCDMVTDGGGYTYHALTGTGVSTTRRTEANSCQALGMDMVVLRSEAQYNALIAEYPVQTYFRTVPGLYGTVRANYTSCAMNSESNSACSTDWRAIDGGFWWLRNGRYSEPNGDYTVDCWLGTDGQFPHQRFNDGNCGYATGTSYICSTNDKGRGLPVTSGLAAHYSARRTLSVVRDGSDVVSAWNDLSGNGRHLSVSGSAPVYASGLINGRPALNFDGAARRMVSPAFPIASEVTVFAVVQWRTPETWGAIAHHGSRDNDWSMEQSGFDPSTVTHFQSQNDNTGNELTLTSGGNYVLAGRIAGTARTFSASDLSGTTSATGSGVSITPGSKVLYVGSSEISEDSRAYIGELVYFTRALSDAERDQVIAYLQSQWGL
ncbi:MAG: fibrinogen-like YCDxxxxGGGW domain-containing protein [Sandaracinaceae bacterium]